MSDRNEPSLMDGEVKERQRYWEEQIRARQRCGRSRNAPAEGTFPETPDLLPDGNVEGQSEWENAGYSEGERFQPGLSPGNVAQVEALQEVENEIAALRQRRRGNVPPASNFRPGAIDDFARGWLVTGWARVSRPRRTTWLMKYLDGKVRSSRSRMKEQA